MVGSSLATGGNLVFSGSSDGHFYAFDAITGNILWSPYVGLATGAAPITYAVNGVQYVAIALGGFSFATLTGMGAGHMGGTLMVFKLHGIAVTPAPAINPGSGFPVGGIVYLISTKGLTEVNPYVYMDATRRLVVFKIVAAATTNNNGFNFDGYAKGAANFIIPAGWHADFIFTNTAVLPHSMAVVTSLDLTAHTVPLAATPNPIRGIGPGPTQYAGYGSVPPPPGRYYLACLVPGHITAGMWDYFTVSATAQAPSIVAP